MSHVCAYSGRRGYPLPDGPTNRGRLNQSMLTFRVYKDKHGEWRWSLRAKNGKIVGDSSEGYKRKSKVTKMISKIILGPHRIIE